MKVLTASVLASVLGFLGMWLLEWRERVEMWAGIEAIKAGGTD